MKLISRLIILLLVVGCESPTENDYIVDTNLIETSLVGSWAYLHTEEGYQEETFSTTRTNQDIQMNFTFLEDSTFSHNTSSIFHDNTTGTYSISENILTFDSVQPNSGDNFNYKIDQEDPHVLTYSIENENKLKLYITLNNSYIYLDYFELKNDN